MGPPTARTVERHLLALDEESFLDFVAALWAESGWTVERDGAVVETTRPGETRRLLVLSPTRFFPGLRRAPSVGGSVDGVVSPFRGTDRSRLPRGTPDASIVDAEDIHERLLYGVDEAARERLLADHLGIASDAPVSASIFVPLPAVRAPRANRAAAAGTGVLLVLVGILVLLAATGAFSPGASSSGTVNASGPATAGAYATAEAPVYAAHPTCDRDPGAVVAIASSALRGPRLGKGLVVTGRFWNPRHVRGAPTGAWNEMMRGPDRLPYYDATGVRFDDPVVEGDRATVNATATINGAPVEYAFQMSRRSTAPKEGCWVIDRFEPT